MQKVRGSSPRRSTTLASSHLTGYHRNDVANATDPISRTTDGLALSGVAGA